MGRDAAREGGAGSGSTSSTQGRVEGASLSAEQQRRVGRTIVSQRNAPRADRVDFAVGIGTIVPTRVRVATVPPALVDIHPDWRGSSYFVVRDEVVILDDRRRIVAVVPTGSGGRAAMGAGAGESSARRGGARGGSDGATGGELSDLAPGQIREVQTVLIERGFLTGEADGVFGPRTRRAIISFQRREGLDTSGSIDMATVRAMRLEAISERSTGRSSTPEGRGDRPDADRLPSDARPGDTGRPDRMDHDSDLPSRTTGSGSGTRLDPPRSDSATPAEPLDSSRAREPSDRAPGGGAADRTRAPAER